jgi:hypothetical protein
MYRVALKFLGYGRGPISADPSVEWKRFGVWRVTKCYHVRKEAEPFTLPVKLDAPGGDRRRLLILTPYFTPPGTYHEPLEILNAYLLSLPVEVKIAREAEMGVPA